MPSLIIAGGGIITNTPQQNSGVYVGEQNFSGFDANMKFNTAQGGNFGIMSVQVDGFNIMLDNLEMIDGVINDQDLKPTLSANA
ncbi:hypothetical protein LLE49_10505 [Alicyclobacillus tolerans]|uniref:hypothetical protein n=1 Tax=Alicyclobacillus tolerans TaxID=90970 RepID=UPI001F45FF62|nr:hypothetical protein [Alicyclobacillus tolerans]MCF8565145.1 hypothetical protein [Alicyclobacillus tolerans]